MIVLSRVWGFYVSAWVDLTSVVFGFFYAWLVRANGRFSRRLLSADAVWIYGEGMTVLCFLLLLPAGFSSAVLLALVESSRLTVFTSGLLGIVTLLRPRFPTI